MKIRRRLLLIPLALFLLAMGGALILGWRSQSLLRSRAARVKIGDTPDEVRALLGPPEYDCTWDTGGWDTDLPESWNYGGKNNNNYVLNLRHPFTRQFPWFVPFRIYTPSLLSYAVDIDFDRSGRVANVRISKP